MLLGAVDPAYHPFFQGYAARHRELAVYQRSYLFTLGQSGQNCVEAMNWSYTADVLEYNNTLISERLAVDVVDDFFIQNYSNFAFQRFVQQRHEANFYLVIAVNHNVWIDVIRNVQPQPLPRRLYYDAALNY
eukprot:Awhi_evm1s1669